MKIISIDSFARETVADVLVAENLNDFWAKCIVECVNNSPSRPDDVWLKEVPDDHKLWGGMQELV